MRRLPALASLTLLLSLTVACAGAQSTDRVVHPVIDSLARSLVGEEMPGLAVLAVRDGQVVHRAAYGVTAAGPDGAAVDAHTPFYIASTAKMFTAAAVLALADDGRLGLDDPIGRYVPAVPEYARHVTVAQLLAHTSGLIDHYDVGGEARTYDNAAVLEILRDADGLLFEPGSRAAYSNSGYVLLARLVEAVTRESFAAFLERRFFGPLGMDDAFVATEGIALPAGRAIGHRRVDGGFGVHDYRSSTTGAGGVYASLSDLERWHRALRDGRVLGPETLRLASRPPVLTSGRLTPYGMGWLAEFAARGPLADRWYVLAFGSLRGFRALFQWYQDNDVLLVWLANADSEAVLDAFHPVPELLLTER